MSPVSEKAYAKGSTVFLIVNVIESETVTDEYGNVIETEEESSEENY